MKGKRKQNRLRARRQKLSIVVTSRNDDHGGGVAQRMNCFMQGIIRQADLYDYPVEVVMVEWNPPANRPSLAEILPLPPKGGNTSLKIVTVPNELHKRFANSEELPLHQMIAKNVGIRRASCDYVLCTNVDIMFNDELFEGMRKKRFKKDVFYRANRHDVPAEVALIQGAHDRLEFCESEAFRVLGRDATRKNLFFEAPAAIIKSRSLSFWANAFAGVGKKMLAEESRLLHSLDLNACGDFTLMSKQAWLDIGGHPELEIYPAHVDSLVLIAAAAAGYKQQIFARRKKAFHIDHPSGWDTGSPVDRLRRAAQRPGLDFAMVNRLALDLFKSGGRLDFNRPDWGLANEELPTEIFR